MYDENDKVFQLYIRHIKDFIMSRSVQNKLKKNHKNSSIIKFRISRGFPRSFPIFFSAGPSAFYMS